MTGQYKCNVRSIKPYDDRSGLSISLFRYRETLVWRPQIPGVFCVGHMLCLQPLYMPPEADHVVQGFINPLASQGAGSLNCTQSVGDFI